MDLASIFAAFGLSSAAGLNAWLPLFGGALLVRLDAVELAEPFDELSSTTGLIVLAWRRLRRARAGPSPAG